MKSQSHDKNVLANWERHKQPLPRYQYLLVEYDAHLNWKGDFNVRLILPEAMGCTAERWSQTAICSHEECIIEECHVL